MNSMNLESGGVITEAGVLNLKKNVAVLNTEVTELRAALDKKNREIARLNRRLDEARDDSGYTRVGEVSKPITIKVGDQAVEAIATLQLFGSASDMVIELSNDSSS